TLTLKEFLRTNALFPNTIFTDQKNTEWWVGEAGLIHFDSDSTVSTAFFNVNPGDYNRNTFVLKNPVSGDYWFHTFNYLFISDQATKTLHSSAEYQSDNPLFQQLWQKYGNTNR